MSKKQVLKVLKENLDWQEYTDGNDSWDDELKEAVTEAIKLLEQQSTQSWIPVSERLPNLDDYTGSEVWQKKVLITGYLSFDDTKSLFVSEAFAKDIVCNSVHDTIVTAWQPLPKPYKIESEERRIKMKLDEAIKHAEEVAIDQDLCCSECAEEHRQLAEWLKDYKRLLEQDTVSKDIYTKTDIAAILTELQLEIGYEAWTTEYPDGSHETIVDIESVSKIIQQKIDKYNTESES